MVRLIVFGWQNSATYGSVISYNVYWIAVIAYFLFMYFREQKEFSASERSDSDIEADNGKGVVAGGKDAVTVDDKGA